MRQPLLWTYETTTAGLELLQDIARKMGLTILLITHEMPVIQQVCDRVAVIKEGSRIVECGPVLDNNSQDLRQKKPAA